MTIDFSKYGATVPKDYSALRSTQQEEEELQQVETRADLSQIDFSKYGATIPKDYSKFRSSTASGIGKAIAAGVIEGATFPATAAQTLLSLPAAGIEALGSAFIPNEYRDQVPLGTPERVTEYFQDQEVDPFLPQVLPSRATSAIYSPEELENIPLGERAAFSTAEAVTSAPTFGLSPLQSLLPSGGAFAAREMGFGPVGQIAGGLAGGIAQAGISGVSDLVKSAAKTVQEKGVKGALAEGLARFYKPKQDAQAIFEATEGNAPFSSLLESKTAQSMESILQKHPATAEAYTEQSEKVVDAFKKSIRNMIERTGVDIKVTAQDSAIAIDNAVSKALGETSKGVSEAENRLISEAEALSLKPSKSLAIAEKEAGVLGSEATPFMKKPGRITTKVLNPIREALPESAPRRLEVADSISSAIEKRFAETTKAESQLWKGVREKIPESAILPQEARKELIADMDAFTKAVASARAELRPHEKDAVINYAENIRKLAKSARFGKVRVQDVIEGIRLGNSIYGGKEGYKKLALSVKSKLEGALEKWGADNKEAYKLYKDAVGATRNKYSTFTSDVMSITKRKGKEGSLGFFTRESGVKTLKEILSPEEFARVHDSIGNLLLTERFGRKAIGEYIKGKDPKAFAEAIALDARKYRGIVPDSKLDALIEASRRAETISTQEAKDISVPGSKLIDTLFSIEKKLAGKDLSPTKRKAYEEFRDSIYEDIGEQGGKIHKLVTERNAAKDTLERLNAVYDKKEGIQSYIKNQLKSEKSVSKLKNELKDIPEAEMLIEQGQKALLYEELEKNIFSKDTFGKREVNFLEKIATDPEYKKLIGPDGVKVIKETQKNAQKLLESASFYANPSGTEVMRTNKDTFLLYGSAWLKFLTTLNPSYLILLTGAKQGASFLSKTLTDPQFKQMYLDAAKKIAAAESGSGMAKRQIMRIGLQISKQLAQVGALQK